jgi:hypothetical protein
MGMVAHTCHHSYAGSINRGIMIEPSQGRKARPYLKNNKNKKGWEYDLSDSVPA